MGCRNVNTAYEEYVRKPAKGRKNFSSALLGSPVGPETINVRQMNRRKVSNFYLAIYMCAPEPSEEKRRPKEAVRAQCLYARLDKE